MALELFVDMISPPCCSVYMFAKKNNIPVEFKVISLINGEHHMEEFVKVNPRRQVPALKDGDFCMAESISMMEYMADKFKTPDHWFPKDLEKRARVKEFLSWQQWGTRLHGPKAFWMKTMAPALKLEVPENKMAAALEDLNSALDQIEKLFIQDGGFIGGGQISIADLVAIVEIMQMFGVGVNVFEGRPKLSAWKERVVQAVGKELFDEAHQAIMSGQEYVQQLDKSQMEAYRQHALRLIS